MRSQYGLPWSNLIHARELTLTLATAWFHPAHVPGYAQTPVDRYIYHCVDPLDPFLKSSLCVTVDDIKGIGFHQPHFDLFFSYWVPYSIGSCSSYFYWTPFASGNFWQVCLPSMKKLSWWLLLYCHSFCSGLARLLLWRSCCLAGLNSSIWDLSIHWSSLLSWVGNYPDTGIEFRLSLD